MSELLFGEEVRRIVGCSMEVLNTIGHGLHEKIYENALVVELKINRIPVVQQPQHPVIYKSVEVGKYIPDLVCFDKILVDTKTIDSVTDREMGQMINYLRITGLELGLLINFKRARLEWKRVVLEKEPRMNANRRE
jgi:GxxExxY protein